MEHDGKESNVMKTGTTTVGVVCEKGIILAADKRATAGGMIVNKKTEKILPIDGRVAITTAGSVSDIQLLVKMLKAEIKLKEMKSNRAPNVEEIANLCSGMIYNNIRRMSMIPGVSHFIMGGKNNGKFQLFDLFPDGSLTNIDDYIASGSGSVFALGVLDTLYKEDMSIEEGTKMVVKAINAALQRDTASGEGIDIITITEEGLKKQEGQMLDTKLKA